MQVPVPDGLADRILVSRGHRPERRGSPGRSRPPLFLTAASASSAGVTSRPTRSAARRSTTSPRAAVVHHVHTRRQRLPARRPRRVGLKARARPRAGQRTRRSARWTDARRATS
jgi:hypothetical protein